MHCFRGRCRGRTHPWRSRASPRCCCARHCPPVKHARALPTRPPCRATPNPGLAPTCMHAHVHAHAHTHTHTHTHTTHTPFSSAMLVPPFCVRDCYRQAPPSVIQKLRGTGCLLPQRLCQRLQEVSLSHIRTHIRAYINAYASAYKRSLSPLSLCFLSPHNSTGTMEQIQTQKKLDYGTSTQTHT